MKYVGNRPRPSDARTQIFAIADVCAPFGVVARLFRKDKATHRPTIGAKPVGTTGGQRIR